MADDEFQVDEEPISEIGRQHAVERSRAVQRRGDKELQRIVDFTAARYNTVFACISVITDAREILLCRYSVPFWEISRSESFCAVAIHRPGEVLVVRDAAQDPRFAKLPIVIAPPHIRFYAGMPIVDRDGYALGALCVADPEPRSGEVDALPLMIFAREVERVLHP